jgi:hypothetical protein
MRGYFWRWSAACGMVDISIGGLDYGVLAFFWVERANEYYILSFSFSANFKSSCSIISILPDDDAATRVERP